MRQQTRLLKPGPSHPSTPASSPTAPFPRTLHPSYPNRSRSNHLPRRSILVCPSTGLRRTPRSTLPLSTSRLPESSKPAHPSSELETCPSGLDCSRCLSPRRRRSTCGHWARQGRRRSSRRLRGTRTRSRSSFGGSGVETTWREMTGVSSSSPGVWTSRCDSGRSARALSWWVPRVLQG